MVLSEQSKQYCDKLKKSFDSHSKEMQKTNHSEGNGTNHNIEPNYFKYLLRDLVEIVDPESESLHFKPRTDVDWSDKVALDFGCGCGRNIKNLYEYGNFSRVDGVDVCKENSKFAKKFAKQNGYPNSKTWENNGYDIQPAKDNTYDFIMSHQVFQHISSYEVRFSLLSDMYRALKENGIISIHFLNLDDASPYHYNDDGTKLNNVWVDSPAQIESDLEKIGFREVSVTTTKNYWCSIGVPIRKILETISTRDPLAPGGDNLPRHPSECSEEKFRNALDGIGVVFEDLDINKMYWESTAQNIINLAKKKGLDYKILFPSPRDEYFARGIK